MQIHASNGHSYRPPRRCSTTKRRQSPPESGLLHPEPAPPGGIDRACYELACRRRLKERATIAALSVLRRRLISGCLLRHVPGIGALRSERLGSEDCRAAHSGSSAPQQSASRNGHVLAARKFVLRLTSIYRHC